MQFFTRWSLAADIYLYGHGHKLLTDSISRLGIQGDKTLVSKDLIICLCGTFLKTYVPGETTYSERWGMAPIRIGHPYITVRPNHTGITLKAHTS